MKKRIFFIILFFILGKFILNLFLIYNFSQKYDEQQSDAILVLGAGVSNNSPSIIFKERLNHAIYLYENNFSNKIILTGGFSEGNNISDAKIGMNYLISNNIDPSNIFLEEKSKITLENIKFSKPIMEKYNFKKIIFVSDSIHMKRIKQIAENEKIDGIYSPVRNSPFKTYKTKIPFILRETFFYSFQELYFIFY